MKVVDTYSKKDLEWLTCGEVPIKIIMDEFFEQFPKSYRENYDKNLETLKLFKVDEHYDGATDGEYSDGHNIILFRKYSALIHELMHMASCDCTTRKSAFMRLKQEPLFEYALIEGMTEYLSSVALNSSPRTYFLETFTASMLGNIDNIFEPYFIPNYDRFINLFPNERDIISLMYSLDYYHDKSQALGNGDVFDEDVVRGRIEHSISDIIDTLIDIQLSMKMGSKKNKIYAERFMDTISNDDMACYVGDFWEEYLDYANEQINKRVLRRIK